MNIQYFRESLDIVAQGGQTLSPELALLIENSLIILQNENKLENIFFWGQIYGLEKDYFIAFGHMKNNVIERKFFYTLNCIHWQLMESPNPELYEACLICSEAFMGDPAYVTTVQLDPKFEFDDNGVVTNVYQLGSVKLREAKRLSCIVQIITDESALIPRGGLYKMPDKSVILNQMFQGLNKIEAKILCNYQLYRKPRNKYNENLLKRYNYNYAIDFLDTLDDIIPYKEAFALSSSEIDDQIIFIKSLIWQGMIFFHKINSKKHGFMYMGCAKKNFNLLFMMC